MCVRIYTDAVTLWPPGITAFILLLLIAGWMLATDFLKLAPVIRARHEIVDEV